MEATGTESSGQDAEPATFDRAFMSVMSRIGARPRAGDPTRGDLRVVPELSHQGVVLITPLMLLADTVMGMAIESQFDDWAFTTDFSFRRGAIHTGDLIEATSSPLRHGRRLLVDALDYVDEHGVSVGHAQITFMRTPLRDGESKPDIEAIRDRMSEAGRPLEESLADLAGIEVVDAAAGQMRLEPHRAVRRPGGFVQGAIVTLLGELAALSMVEADRGTPCVVTDLDVRFLIGGRSGPLTTTASFIGDPSRGVVRVDLIDEGHDVLSATFLARVEGLQE